MARVREMKVGFKATVNMGSFESVSVEYSEIVELAAQDETQAVRAKLIGRVRTIVEREIEGLRDSSRVKDEVKKAWRGTSL